MASTDNGGRTQSTVSTLAFVGMTCALAVSIRNIPDVASTGWTMFFYMLVAMILFGFPIALIAGEFTTAYPGAGGPELWITKSLSPRWGFTTSWLLWVQMFPGMVMVASALAPLAGYTIATNAFNPNDPGVLLGQNNLFTLGIILVVYWAVTLLNMKFDMAKIGGKIGVWLGIYIPCAVMFVLGVAYTIHEGGIVPGNTLGAFDPAKLVPDADTFKTLSMFSTIIMIFTGIEMSAVYVQRLKEPTKQYPRGIFIALLLMLVFNIANGLLVANAVPMKDGASTMELNNIAQAVVIYCQTLGLPSWIVNVFAGMVLIGVAVQLSGWVSGPSQTIAASALRGEYPPKWKFWKTSGYGLSKSVLIVQAVIISLFSLTYLLIPAINTAFLMLVNATTLMYCLVYVLMAVGIVRLRVTQPDLQRPFRIGKKGNGLCYAVAIVLLAVIFGANFLTALYSSAINNIVVFAVTAILFVIPLVIYKFKNPDWATEVQAEMAKDGIELASDGTIDGVNAGVHAAPERAAVETTATAPSTAGAGAPTVKVQTGVPSVGVGANKLTMQH